MFAEQRARAASEAKDNFIAMLSHELRTPLTPILLAIDTLMRSGAPTAAAPTLEMMRRNIQLEARLIDDLLDLTRITRGKLRLQREAVDAHKIVAETVEMCGAELRAAGIVTELDLTAPEHHVLADPTRLRQVIWNLIRNSIRHTPAGGK